MKVKCHISQGNSCGGPRRARTDDRRIKRTIITRSACPRSGNPCVVPTGSLTLRPVDFGDCVPHMCHIGSSLLIVRRLTLQKEPAEIQRSGGGAEVRPSPMAGSPLPRRSDALRGESSAADSPPPAAAARVATSAHPAARWLRSLRCGYLLPARCRRGDRVRGRAVSALRGRHRF